MHDAAPGGEPLRVTAAEARRRTERVGVVDDAAPHVGDGLEAAVRVLREARHLGARGTCASRRRRRSRRRCSRPASDASGPKLPVARRVGVVVVHAEQERVDRRPRAPGQRHRLEHDLGHDLVHLRCQPTAPAPWIPRTVGIPGEYASGADEPTAPGGSTPPPPSTASTASRPSPRARWSPRCSTRCGSRWPRPSGHPEELDAHPGRRSPMRAPRPARRRVRGIRRAVRGRRLRHHRRATRARSGPRWGPTRSRSCRRSTCVDVFQRGRIALERIFATPVRSGRRTRRRATCGPRSRSSCASSRSTPRSTR